MHMNPRPRMATFRGHMKMETKQAKSRQDTQKQELTPDYLHLCTREEGAGMRGQHREKQEQLRHTGQEKKHHSQVGDEACAFTRVRAKGRVFLSAGETQRPREGQRLSTLSSRPPQRELSSERLPNAGHSKKDGRF